MTAPRRAALPELRESDITAQIKQFLESRGWYAIRLQSGTVRGVTQGTYMRLGKKGLPDWVMIRGREALFVEVKRPSGKMSRDQEKWFEWASVKGMQAICANGLGVFLEHYGKIYTR